MRMKNLLLVVSALVISAVPLAAQSVAPTRAQEMKKLNPAAQAQANKKPNFTARVTAHGVTLSWTTPAVTVPANLAYSVYRCGGTLTNCSTPASFGAAMFTGITSLSFTDTTVKAGGSYVYEGTSTCATNCGTAAAPLMGESAPAGAVAVTIPADTAAPPPPGNFAVTSSN